MTEGSEFIQVRGIVRSTDIQMDNSVSSQRLANAQISYKGTGDLAASTKPGWLSSALFKFWPL
jgi:flagellar L-ring protein precursor FlgH